MFALIKPVITSTEGRCVASNEVNARGARLLRQPGDELFNLLADHQHEVGKLIDDDDDDTATVSRSGTSAGSSRDRRAA